MKAKKITEAEIEKLKISYLPPRPTAPLKLGGLGYTSKDMREAFDKLSLFIIERFNELIDDIETESTDSIINTIQVGYGTGITLMEFLFAFANGQILSNIPMGEETLLEYLMRMRNDVDECMAALGIGD